MKKPILYSLWAVIYILCASLSFVAQPVGAAKVFLILLSLAFFVPGTILLYDGKQAVDKKTVRTIRLVSVLSLSLTLVMLVANFASVLASEAVGNTLDPILALVSVRMMCSHHWVLSLFLWACLLTASFIRFPKK